MKTQKEVKKGVKKGENKDAGKEPTKIVVENRLEMLAKVWGKRKPTRLNKIIDANYCGILTVRELAAIVLADNQNFPRGLDTALCIGDFEGNFCTNMLSVTVGGPMSDHVCLMGDPHGTMD